MGLALKTGFAYSYSLRSYSATVLSQEASALVHGNYISWKLAAEMDINKFALGLSFGLPILYAELSSSKIGNQSLGTSGITTNYDAFTEWRMFQMNIYAMYRF